VIRVLVGRTSNNVLIQRVQRRRSGIEVARQTTSTLLLYKVAQFPHPSTNMMRFAFVLFLGTARAFAPQHVLLKQQQKHETLTMTPDAYLHLVANVVTVGTLGFAGVGIARDLHSVKPMEYDDDPEIDDIQRIAEQAAAQVAQMENDRMLFAPHPPPRQEPPQQQQQQHQPQFSASTNFDPLMAQDYNTMDPPISRDMYAQQTPVYAPSTDAAWLEESMQDDLDEFYKEKPFFEVSEWMHEPIPSPTFDLPMEDPVEGVGTIESATTTTTTEPPTTTTTAASTKAVVTNNNNDKHSMLWPTTTTTEPAPQVDEYAKQYAAYFQSATKPCYPSQMGQSMESVPTTEIEPIVKPTIGTANTYLPFGRKNVPHNSLSP